MPNESPESAAKNESPEGAAVFPMIPAELGVHPLLLATLHAYVFLEGSDEPMVNDVAATEALEYIVTYLQRLQKADLKRIEEDFATLIVYAKQQKWPKQQIRFLQDFLVENGISKS